MDLLYQVWPLACIAVIQVIFEVCLLGGERAFKFLALKLGTFKAQMVGLAIAAALAFPWLHLVLASPAEWPQLIPAWYDGRAWFLLAVGLTAMFYLAMRFRAWTLLILAAIAINLTALVTCLVLMLSSAMQPQFRSEVLGPAALVLPFIADARIWSRTSGTCDIERDILMVLPMFGILLSYLMVLGSR
jgi:hypothetical protein